MKILFPLLIILVSVFCYAQDLKCVSDSPYYMPKFSANWFRATEYCNSLGMRLAVITNKEANTRAILALETEEKKLNTSLTEVWLGGSDLATEGEFYWQPTGTKFEYSFWMIGEPNNENVENCLQFRYRASDGWGWNDKNCSLERVFMCENTEPKRVVVVF
ncbi:CD209 antigen-like protein C [Malaya genurostris]|uniref:CD209 antigen-like protein C n=1 Tax=Malaya genurostris TaxID=325434 RepID=UPI0026F3B91A|nr:CD209 antigen-like protein C [Malaya genurostris]